MPIVGDRWEGLIKCSRPKGWGPKKAKELFLNENLDFLHIKVCNLYSQTKEQDFLVLFKTKKSSGGRGL
jgi:hypothetical protein